MLKPGCWIVIFLLPPTLAALTTFGKAGPTRKPIGLPHGFRLPASVKPEHYKLEIVTHLGDEDGYSFSGKVWIKINCEEDTKNITLHSKYLDINTTDIVLSELIQDGKRSIPIGESHFETEFYFLILFPTETLKIGQQYELYIPFRAELDESLYGYYISSYVDRNTQQRMWISSTQFESSAARRAFPCFDEPEMKAKFEIILGHEKKYNALSNMPVNITVPMEDKPEWVWSHFEVTPPMSTYLVAYSINNFKESTVKMTDDVVFRVWSRRDALDQVEYANDIGPKLLKFYEDYFDVKFPLPKIDMIAVPHFPTGASENWGLLSYSEGSLLFSSNVSSSTHQHQIASIIAHELAHQWFGNLVTMRWWTDLWLKEGFATYVAALGVDFIHPEWNSFTEETSLNHLMALRLDALESSHPLSVPINRQNEIPQLYDTVTYMKGYSIVRMMHSFLGEKAFRSGVTNYLKKYKYGNAEQDNLWECLTEEAHKQGSLPESITVKQIMDSWTLQSNYPMITVSRNYESGSAEISQKRYLTDAIFGSRQPERCWWIPLSYTSEEQLDFNNTQAKSWLTCSDQNVSIPETLNDLPKEMELLWLLFNIEMSGLYRVKYDEGNWDLFFAQLLLDSNVFSTISRAQLIDDAFKLAWSGNQSYSTALLVVQYLRHEKEYIPWKTALDNLNALNLILRRTSLNRLFKRFIQNILEPIYQSVGGLTVDRKAMDRLGTVKLKVLVASWSCEFSVGDCELRSKQLFAEWMNTDNPSETNPVPIDLRSVVYCTAIRVGGEKEWNFLWQQYVASNSDAEKIMILESLGCSREVWLLDRYLDWSVDNSSGIRKMDTGVVFQAVAASDIGFYMAETFLFGRYDDIDKFVEPAAPYLATYTDPLVSQMFKSSERSQMSYFLYRRYYDESESTRRALETIVNNEDWMRSNFERFGRILKDFIVSE